MTDSKLTLVYFPIGGRAEPIRLTAAVGGIAFTNKVCGLLFISKQA